jgi:hypothetical protein
VEEVGGTGRAEGRGELAQLCPARRWRQAVDGRNPIAEFVAEPDAENLEKPVTG